MAPEVKWVEGDDGWVAYQVVERPGDGVDVAFLTSWGSTIDMIWESPLATRFLTRLSRLGRLVLHDKRGTGVSDPVTPKGAGAVRCAQAIASEVRQLGLDVRAGVHAGEVEQQGDRPVGIAVHIAARVQAAAMAGEVLVSRTVKDLVAGSGLVLEDRGDHVLKGVPDPWQLYAVVDAARV